MRNLILILLLALHSHSVYGHGFDVSTIEEVHGQVDLIFAVKITKVSKPKEGYTGKKPYPVEIDFGLIEALKGNPTAKTKGIYTHPAIETEFPNGKVMRVWLKVLASGNELSVVKGKEYLIYAHKHGMQENNPVVRIVRIDPISEKQKLTVLLKESRKKSQQD